MATNIDAILAKLKELQQVIPGVENSIARLQVLLKASFEGGSVAAVKGIELELQNLAASANTAIGAMSNTTKAQAAMESLRTSIAEVKTALATLTGPQVAGTTTATSRERLEFEREYQNLIRQGMAEPKARAEATAREQAAAAQREQIALQERLNSTMAAIPPTDPNRGSMWGTSNFANLNAAQRERAKFEAEYNQLRGEMTAQLGQEAPLPSERAAAQETSSQKIAAAFQQEAKAVDAAVQSEISALDKIIIKQREIYGVGQKGQLFSQTEMVKNITAAAGGTRALRKVTGGEDANVAFNRMLASGEIQQSETNKYKYKFTELNAETLRVYRRALEELGLTAEETDKKLDELYRGTRLAPPTTQPQKMTREMEEQQRLAALQTTGVQGLFGSPQQFDKFKSRIKDLGLSLIDLKSATQDVASGMTTLSFEALDKSTGIVKNATVYIDEFGRVINQGTSRVKSFEDMITHNITKVMTWALALGVVYGSMQKIGELVESMKKIQDAMVDIGITTKASAAALDEVYQGVLNISRITATDLTGGLTSFNQALRATGGAADASTRSSLALKLLTDSLTLAKLGGLDTKRAMDLLIAGLKQLDQPLDTGAQLLDKFQAISNIANTSVEDMASTFAITAGAASDVGVNVNNLVALIGAFSEATTLSATETGNALRAMFSNFTQPAGIEVLNKYGIAVQDINGEFRSFIDVFQQASQLARSGVLSERQVAEIANALGGGSRRQAQVTALLTVAPRQVNLREFLDQGKEAGAAQDALQQKTGTLSSAIERLQNAFDNLGKSLGTSGGFIDALTSIINLLTKVIDLASELTKAIGPGLPLLLAGVAGYSLFKSQGPGIGKFGGQLMGAIGSPIANLKAADQTAMQYPNTQNVEALKAAGVTFGKNAFTALLPIIPLLAGQVAESAQTGDWTGTVGMGIGAAFLGVLSGNPIWAIIGGLIGKAIADQIVSNQKVTEKYGAAMAKPLPTVPTDVTAEEMFKRTEELRQQLEALQGERNVGTTMEAARFGPEFGAKLLPMLAEEYKNLIKTMSPAEAYGRLQNQRFVMERGTNFLGQPYEKAIGGTGGYSLETIKKFAEGTDLLDQFLLNLRNLVEKSKDLPADMADMITNQAFMITKEAFVGTAKGIQSATATGEIINTPEYEYNRRKRYEFTSQLTKGELTTGEYKGRMEALGSTGITASLVTSALHPEINVENVAKYKEEWLKVKDALTVADQGTQTYISSVATNLVNLEEEMAKLRNEEDLYKRGLSSLDASGYETLKIRIADVGTQADISRAQIEALLKAIEDSNNAAKFQFKGFADYSKYTAGEMQNLIAQARGLQDIYATQTNTPLDQLIKTAPDIVTMTKEGFSTWQGVYQQFLDQVLTDVDDFRTRMEEKMKFNFKSLRNVPAEMAQRLQQAMNYYTALLSKYGFNERNELITVLFKDNQVGQLVGSQTALQLALEDLTEVEQKKLDGIYNLPSGATAFIPLQAGQLLAEYTKNTQPAMNVNYGATPTAPPKVGSYPLGYPTTELSPSEVLRRYLQEHPTALQQQAADLGREKYLRETGLPTMISRPESEWGKPYFDFAKTFFKQTAAPAPAEPTAVEGIVKTMALIEPLISVQKQLLGSFMKFFGAGGLMNLFGMPEGYKGTKATSEASPIKININQERQTHDISVNMAINLDSRRLWEGIKKIAMADYARLTASIGESVRSRGNVM